VPDSEEAISYGMPGFKNTGVFAWFAAFSDHYSFFVPPGLGAYKEYAAEVKPYLKSKSAMHFSFDGPIPLDLIAKLSKYSADQRLKS
jgi:uncharacterized protein YdhG (YjbR/CyaY superfamily)